MTSSTGSTTVLYIFFLWLIFQVSDLFPFFFGLRNPHRALGVVWTTPLVASLGSSLTIPLAMLGDMVIHGRHYSIIYILGSVQVRLSETRISANNVNEQKSSWSCCSDDLWGFWGHKVALIELFHNNGLITREFTSIISQAKYSWFSAICIFACPFTLQPVIFLQVFLGFGIASLSNWSSAQLGLRLSNSLRRFFIHPHLHKRDLTSPNVCRC